MADFEVRPYEKVPAQVIKVSVTDAIAPKNWPLQLVFWPLEDAGLARPCHENLKEGLSRLLADVPALAGNITRGSEEDPRDLAITIRDGAAVEFPFEDVSAVEAIPSYDDLLRGGFPTTGLKVPLSPKASLGPMVEGSPMFCAKLNQIRGGLVLAFGFAHVLADGLAVSELSRLWSLHTANGSQGVAFRKLKIATPDEEIRKYLSTPPRLDPGAALDSFLQVVPSEEAVNHLPRDAASAQEAKQKTTAIMMGHLAAIGEKPETRSFAMWKFTPEKLAELKKAASGSAVDWVSTMDALAGLFWSRIARVQRQGAGDGHHQTSTCVFSMSIRHRLQPPIPPAYIGNAFSPVGAECALAELESDDGAVGLRAAALSLRRANTDWSQARWDVWLNRLISLPTAQTISVNWHVTLGKHNLRFNDYSKYQLNLTDWGAPLGQVARTRCLRPAHPGGALGLWVSPRLADGSLEVSLVCSDALRQSLLEDDMFKRYAEFVCHHT